MGHLSYEESKKVVFKGLIILGVVTIIEVLIALVGKGYIIKDFHLPVWLMYILMITFSLYKAYFIVYEFMHMRYEVPGLVRSVLFPTLLLVWAIIAFFSEGAFWKNSRALVSDHTNSQLDVIPTSHKSTHPGGHGDAEIKHEETKIESTPTSIDTSKHEVDKH